MGNNSKIQWCDHTWNIGVGCEKLDGDCKFCYMYRDTPKYGWNPKEIIKTKGAFTMPLRIKEPSKIFVSSWTDFFLDKHDSYRDEAWDIIRKCPQHTFQILTKRPERINDHLPSDWGEGWDNVWIGTSVGSMEGIHGIHDLLKVQSKVRFISFEPLWQRIDLSQCGFDLSKIHWAILGGESGNETGKYRYRPCQLEWFEKLINDLSPTTRIFVKQLGTHLSKEMRLNDRHGGDISEFPEHLQIRDMPDPVKKDMLTEKNTCVGYFYDKSEFTDKDWDVNNDLLRVGIPLVYHPDDENGDIWKGMYFSKVALSIMDLVSGGVLNNCPNADAIRLFKKHYPKEFEHYVKHKGSPEIIRS